MNNAEYARLLEELSSRAFTVKHKGIDLIVKPIPGTVKTGVLDPRVLKVQRDQAAANPFRNRGDSQPIDPKTFPVENIRSAMGWPNIDVTSGTVRTDEATAPGPAGPVPLRVYTPSGPGSKSAVVFFHGGGFFGGSLKTVENPCKALAEKSSSVVVSVDYRLAPEYPFPAGPEDCFAAVKWVGANAASLGIGLKGICVAGDSAGANLAAVCSILDRDRKTSLIAAQALIYPVVDIPGVPIGDHEWTLDEYEITEEKELTTGVAVALRGTALLRVLYLQGHPDTDPLVSPLYLGDPAGLPRAFIATGEYDALRLEGEAYARKLSRSGVETRLLRYKGMDHAFLDKLGIYPQAEDLVNELAKWLRKTA